MRFLVLLLVVFSSINLYSQELSLSLADKYQATDALILAMPRSEKRSVESIAKYISTKFEGEVAQAAAIYTWIARNMEYDVDRMFALNSYQDSTEVIDEALQKRKGICMHFAFLFNDIAKELGLRAFVVSGMTKQEGFVDYLSHAWCAVETDGNWRLYDPTWGAGYYDGTEFVNEINFKFCAIKPKKFTQSHLPFDPLWQFMEQPVSTKEFRKMNVKANPNTPIFNFRDTLAQYEQLPEVDKLRAISRRMQQNGVDNALQFNRLQNLEREIEYWVSFFNVDKYNKASNSYNEGVDYLNKFIAYRNSLFRPKKTEAVTREMVDKPAELFQTARSLLQEIKQADENVIQSMIQLHQLLEDSGRMLAEHQAFVDKYFNTKKILRPTLFYR